jgi:hypothetical protein
MESVNGLKNGKERFEKEIETMYKPKVGQTVWMIDVHSLLAIKVKVEEVDERFNNVWVDEPTGYGIPFYNFFKNKWEAVLALQKEPYDPEDGPQEDFMETLGDWRQRKAEFIAHTHGISLSQFFREHPSFAEKKKGKDWVNVKSVVKSECQDD